MEQSKVFFTDLRTTSGENLLEKLERLVCTAGFKTIDFDRRYAAIKLHFGEPGNLAYLRPNFARVLVQLIRSLGGNPFVTDCNTLYVGRRKDALEHLDAAYENGYNPFSTGCHVIIADGLKGTDEALIAVENGQYVKEAKIGRAVADADIIISLNHFKGHECAGFGGAMKNLGMGCGSRAGKMEMHSAGKPAVDDAICVGCGMCLKICAHSAITIENHKAQINHSRCVGCGRCLGLCSFNAIGGANDESNDILNKKIAEYTYAVVKGKPNFHINLIIDVSPCCDCHSENDTPIIPDVGMLASFDPVALDQASADLCNQQPVMPHSVLAEVAHNHKDHFSSAFPQTRWETCLEHAEVLGIGTRQYQLINI